MDDRSTYIIVGGGTAAARAVEGIRSRDTTGSITLFCREPHLPYDRPPLSKGLWLGKVKPEELPVHERSFYENHGVSLCLGVGIEGLDTAGRRVKDAQGNQHGYDRLLIATGGRPRRLEFGEGMIRYFRTVDDYQSLLHASETAESVMIIGGGFIGVELAAALNLRGKKASVLFPGEYLLERVLPADLAEYVTRYYREKGVEIIHGDLPVGIEQKGKSYIISTMSGKALKADVVLAAVGLELNTSVAASAGISTGDGIIVNRFLQTSDPAVYAAGDVALFPSPVLGKSVRIEHWDNARAQGLLAGENMAGANKPFDYMPFFYSDLFDLGFEAVGDLDSHLEVYADWHEKHREGVLYYIRQGVVRGVLLWNVWEKVDAARALIASGTVCTNPADLRGRI